MPGYRAHLNCLCEGSLLAVPTTFSDQRCNLMTFVRCGEVLKVLIVELERRGPSKTEGGITNANAVLV